MTMTKLLTNCGLIESFYKAKCILYLIEKNIFGFGIKIDFKNRRDENSLSDIKENYYCQLWFKFTFISIMLILYCLLLHFQEEQEEEAATEGVLYKES